MVTLPYSGHRRSSDPYCALILAAPRLAVSPFDLDRIILRPGKTVPELSLWPTPDAPRIPILLECTMSPRSRAGVCAYRGESLYLLWRYERDRHEWVEVARCFSMYDERWAYLHPLIVRELARSGAGPPVELDLGQLIRETAELLDARLRDLRDEERAAMLCQVHDLLAGRIAATNREFHAVGIVSRPPYSIRTEHGRAR